MVSALLVALLATFVLVGLDGWSYYTLPARLRGLTPAHRWLRPSGLVGQPFGIGGFLLMLVPVVYAARKRWTALRSAGSMKTWLDVHVVCGIVGPVLVTFHTSFKFNGLVSVAYWSMVTVGLSGFAGRYLYVRIPRSLRGIELTRTELDAQTQALSDQLVSVVLPAHLLQAVAAFEEHARPKQEGATLRSLVAHEWSTRRERRRLRTLIAGTGASRERLEEAVRLVTERATLARRAAYLQTTKRLFDAWHVFHMPLVYVMFLIVVMHVAVTLYMGYVPFRR